MKGEPAGTARKPEVFKLMDEIEAWKGREEKLHLQDGLQDITWGRRALPMKSLNEYLGGHDSIGESNERYFSGGYAQRFGTPGMAIIADGKKEPLCIRITYRKCHF